MTTNHRILFFDVESAPAVAFVWQAKTDYINSTMFIHDTFLLTWAAKWAGDDEIMYGRLTSAEAQAHDDSRIAGKLADLIREADVVVAHNGDRFDLPKLNTRLIAHELEPLGPVHSIDTLKLVRSKARFLSNKLDYLAQQFGVGAKLSTSFDLWRRAYDGDVPALKEMDLYCRQDVVILERVFDRLRPYVKLPRLVDPVYPGEFACTSCGSHNLQRRGFERTASGSFQRYQCQECGKWSRDRSSAAQPKMATMPLA